MLNVRDLRRRPAPAESVSPAPLTEEVGPRVVHDDDPGVADPAYTPDQSDTPGEREGEDVEREGGTDWQPYSSSDMLATVVESNVPSRKATRGWRKAFGLKVSKAEMVELTANEAMATAFGRPIVIVVANPKGGAGKSPTSLALGGAFGSARGGGVLALETHELEGTMALRTVGEGGTVRGFLRNRDRLRADTLARGEVEAYTRKQHSGLFEAMVAWEAGNSQLTGEEFDEMLAILRRFYSVIIIETANNRGASAWRAAMRIADALVVPVKWSSDVIFPATEMLEDLQTWRRDLARRAVVVATYRGGDIDPVCRARSLPWFQQRAARVMELPSDPHISTGGPILWDQLTENYRVQSRELGAVTARAARESVFGNR